MEKLQKVQINLPGYYNAVINIHYYDSSPNSEAHQPIILASHGTPGSHKDFKYMVPALLDAGFRLIILNWPGKSHSMKLSSIVHNVLCVVYL